MENEETIKTRTEENWSCALWYLCVSVYVMMSWVLVLFLFPVYCIYKPSLQPLQPAHLSLSSSHICSALGDGCVFFFQIEPPLPNAILSVNWRTRQSVILQPQLLIAPDTHSSDTELTELLSSWMKLYISRWGEGPILLATHSSVLVHWWGSGCAVIKEGVKEARGLGDLLRFLSKRSWTFSCSQKHCSKKKKKKTLMFSTWGKGHYLISHKDSQYFYLSMLECDTRLKWYFRLHTCQLSCFTCESHTLSHSHEVKISGIVTENKNCAS